MSNKCRKSIAFILAMSMASTTVCAVTSVETESLNGAEVLTEESVVVEPIVEEDVEEDTDTEEGDVNNSEDTDDTTDETVYDEAWLNQQLRDTEDGGTILIPSGVEIVLSDYLSITKEVTLRGVGKQQPVILGKPIYVGGKKPVSFENIEFRNAEASGCAIYAEDLRSDFYVNNCTFGTAQHEALQLLPRGNAKIEITNSYFTTNRAQVRFIHVESTEAKDGIKVNQNNVTVKITGNTFDNSIVSPTNIMGIVRIPFDNVEVGGNIVTDTSKLPLRMWVGICAETSNTDITLGFDTILRNITLPNTTVTIGHGETKTDAHTFNKGVCTVCGAYEVTDEATLAEAIINVEDGGTVYLYGGVEITLENLFTVNKNVTIEGVGDTQPIIQGKGLYIGYGKDITLRNINFAHAMGNKMSAIYAEDLISKVVIDNCTFGDAQWDSLQLLPRDNAEIEITNCVFNSSSANQIRYIHIETTHEVDGVVVDQPNVKIKIEGNEFHKVKDNFDTICVARVPFENVLVGKNTFVDPITEDVAPTLWVAARNSKGKMELLDTTIATRNVQANETTKVNHGVKSSDHTYSKGYCSVCNFKKPASSGGSSGGGSSSSNTSSSSSSNSTTTDTVTEVTPEEEITEDVATDVVVDNVVGEETEDTTVVTPTLTEEEKEVLDNVIVEKLTQDASDLVQNVIETTTNVVLEHKAQVKENVGIMVDGKTVVTENKILSENNRTFLPLRDLADALGLKVGYNPASKVAFVVKDGKTLEFVLGTNVAIINGEETVMLDETNENVRVIAENGRTYLPVRFVAEQLGLNVNYVNDTIYINQ